MHTILVLGGGGFLAEEISLLYRERGWRVVSVGRSGKAAHAHVHHNWHLPHPEFGHLLAVEQPQLCVNAAGRASVQASMVDPLADFDGSVNLNLHVLEDIRRFSLSTVYLHLSSAAVYGNPESLPIHESMPTRPISAYGWHKRMSEMVLEEYASLYGLRAASLRIFSAYGTRLHRQVVWDLACQASTLDEGPLQLQGREDDSRDFVHAADVANAVACVTERGPLAGECYNVANGIEVPIAELANLILRLLGRKQEIVFDGVRRPGNPNRWHADIGKLRGLGFEPAVPLQRGVAEVIAEVGTHANR